MQSQENLPKPNKRFKSISFGQATLDSELVNKRLQELSVTGGLDSKFTGPGPAQYQMIVTKDAFENAKSIREQKKPNYSFNKALKYP